MVLLYIRLILEFQSSVLNYTKYYYLNTTLMCSNNIASTLYFVVPYLLSFQVNGMHSKLEIRLELIMVRAKLTALPFS